MTVTDSSRLTSQVLFLGAKAYELRTRKKLTLAQLAEQSGRSERAIRSLEKGSAANPQLATLIDVLRALDVDLVLGVRPRPDGSLQK